MSDVRPTNARQSALIDPAANLIADPSGFSVGVNKPFWGERLLWCASLSAPSAVSHRYQPSHPPQETCNFGIDFSPVVPFGVGLQSGSISIFANLATPVAADADWVKGPVVVRGRAIYALLGGGVAGTDYQLRWTAVDNQGNTWPRTALCLCAQTS